MKNIVAIDVGNSETTVGVGNNLSWRSYRYTTRKTTVSYTHLTLPTITGV